MNKLNSFKDSSLDKKQNHEENQKDNETQNQQEKVPNVLSGQDTDDRDGTNLESCAQQDVVSLTPRTSLAP